MYLRVGASADLLNKFKSNRIWVNGYFANKRKIKIVLFNYNMSVEIKVALFEQVVLK